MEDEIVDIDGEHEEAIDIEMPTAQGDNVITEAILNAVKTEVKTPRFPPLEQFHPAQDARPPPTAASTTMNVRRSSRANLTQPRIDSSERTTRSSTMNARPRLNSLSFQPKLKLKVNERQAAGMSFLGPYDRELDSDDEDLTFEEQFILRIPPGEDCEKLRAMVDKRDVSKDVWFKFKDSRRGIFHIGDTTYSTKLVDLPCIVESQKTLDNKNMFKVADICQMLLVEDKMKEEEEGFSKWFNLDEFIYPHGISPPLHWVRKRRFRKRVNRRTIETVEEEVERLLAEDAGCSRVEYIVLDNVNPDLSDSEFIDPEDAVEDVGQDELDVSTPANGADEEEAAEDEEEEEEEEEGDIDEELAAELAREMGEEAEDDEDEEGSESESEDEEDEDEDEEAIQARKLLTEEIGDLEAAITRKKTEINASLNPLIKKRFEDQLRKMRADLEQKQAQREQLVEEQRLKKAGTTRDSMAVDSQIADDGGAQEMEQDDDDGADMEEIIDTPG